jgi:localization factor PodJL
VKKRMEQTASEARKPQAEPVAASAASSPSPKPVAVVANASKEKRAPAAGVPAPTPSTVAPKSPPEATPPFASPSPAIAPKETIAAVAPVTPKEALPPEPKPASAPSASEQIADADAALADQRYADAMKILRPLADVGNAHAQVRLAALYAEGRGVERDAAAAKGWYEKAANGGDIGAMLKLGAMFASSGALQNYNLAYIWYGAAAELGAGAAKAERDRIAAQLQPAERQQADRVIRSKVEQLKKGRDS